VYKSQVFIMAKNEISVDTHVWFSRPDRAHRTKVTGCSNKTRSIVTFKWNQYYQQDGLTCRHSS
jgi:hypothetical protein